MAIISQIFLHSKNQQSDETEPKQQQYIENTRFTLKRPQHIRKTKSNIIKTPHRLKKKKRNTVHDKPALLTLKFCKSYIINIR
jgi:hypothetical protein